MVRKSLGITVILIAIQRVLEWIGFISILLAQPYILSNVNKYAFRSLQVIESMVVLTLLFMVVIWTLLRKYFKMQFIIASQDNINLIRFALILVTFFMLPPFAFQGILDAGTHQLSAHEPLPQGTLGWFSYAFFPTSILMAPLLMFWRVFDFLISANGLTLVSLLLISMSSLAVVVSPSIGSYIGLGMFTMGWLLPYLTITIPNRF